MLYYFLYLWAVNGGQGLLLGTRYESPPIENELIQPYSMSFDRKGFLFVADRVTAKIHIWDPQGKYQRSFGKKGNGPGEFQYPAKIFVGDRYLWVYDLVKFCIYGVNELGEQVKKYALSEQPVNLEILDEDSWAIARGDNANGKGEVVFFGYREKEKIFELRYDSKSYLPSGKLIAYGPHPELQRDEHGQVYIGYSHVKEVYIVKDGAISEKRTYDLPKVPVTAEEKAYLQNWTVTVWNGQRIQFDTGDYDYSRPKSYYTHFLIKGKRIAFISTPIGGHTGIGNGFSRGTYFICDLKEGTLLSRGSYRLPDESAVLYRNGRILAMINTEEGDWVLHEANLEGL